MDGGAEKWKIQRLRAEEIDIHRSILSVSLENGSVEEIVMANHGSAKNKMPPSIFDLIKNSGAALRIKQLNQPHFYAAVDRTSKV